MAKFCTKCGRRLIDGQPCSCTQTQQPVHDMQESVQKEVKDKADAAVNRLPVHLQNPRRIRIQPEFVFAALFHGKQT